MTEKSRKRYITITKEYYKDVSFEINLPTFKCKCCGVIILDIPSNFHLKKPVDNSKTIQKHQ